MGIERFDRDTTPETVVGTLKRDGVAIVEGVLSPERVDRVVDELQPMFDRVPISGDDWTGRRAQIVHTAVKYSATYRELLLDPFFLGTVDGVLGMNCHSWRLSASSVMTVHGGGGRQPLHRDEDIYEHFVDRSPEAPPYILGFMLALTDFTEANGATRYVPGSNQWLRDRTPGESEVSRAVMPRGSLAIWLGATFHGLGVNETETPRCGVITLCNVGWLRQEENFYGSVPQDVAAAWPERLQQMLGWQQHGVLAGFIPGRDPTCQLRRA